MARIMFAECEETQSVDIAIIGAGISGLYCAWRLLEADPSRTIVIIERLNRTGGRLNTDIIDFGDGVEVREEEGGMRFNYDMDELMNLNMAMGLCDKIVKFPMGSDKDPNRYLLRGHSFTLAEAIASKNMIWSQIYDLKPEETGLSPTDLITIAFKNILYVNGLTSKDGEPPEFWTDFREKVTWNGKTMNQWQLWGLLRDMNYSEACIEMLTETIGFAGPFKSMANAGDALQILADFPKDPEYFTFARGFSTLPNAVATRLEHDHGDNIKILLSTNVDSISEDGQFVLSVTKAPEEWNASPVIEDGMTKTIRAEKLIVAVATKGMEDLFIRSPVLRSGPDAQKLWDNIHSALGMKLMKINLYFDSPWWGKDGLTQRPDVQFGPNFSNLPINAVYPFYALSEIQRILQTTSDECDTSTLNPSKEPAALTIYCDFNNTNFWHGLQNIEPMFTSPMQEKQNAKRPQTLYPASQAVVAEARKQLAALFDVNWVPEPVLTSYRLWNGEEDFEYAYHQWKLGVVDSEVRCYLAAPRKNLHFCNESISDMQGWVNGSIRSVNLVLEHFGLSPMPDDPCIKPTNTPSAASTRLKALRRPGLWGG